MSYIKSIGQGVRGLRLPKIQGFPLTLNVALTTVLRTNVLHYDALEFQFFVTKFSAISYFLCIISSCGFILGLFGCSFYRAMHFSAKRGIAIACRLSVCPSVRP